MAPVRILLAAMVGLSSVGVSVAQEKAWPPEEGAKVPGNALAVPTTLSGVEQSLASMLTQGASVVAVSDGQNGPVVTVRFKRKIIMCYVMPAPVGGVPTSQCWRLN